MYFLCIYIIYTVPCRLPMYRDTDGIQTPNTMPSIVTGWRCHDVWATRPLKRDGARSQARSR